MTVSIQESLLCEDPAIASAVIFGDGRLYIGAILSPASNYKHLSASEFVELVWTNIEKLNRRVFGHSQTPKHALIVERDDKPFLYTRKGTVRGQAVRELYEEDIERVYSQPYHPFE